MTPSFEQGPIRPPSEARSLLVRVFRNCPWNRCTFCPVYKRRSPSSRPGEEILADVDAMAAAAAEIRRVAGEGATGARLAAAARRAAVPDEAFQVALFLADGARHVFLQDADPLAAPPAKLVAVLARVRERFPSVSRVTTYARVATLARRSPEALAALAAAGLHRIHVGLESGDDDVLAAVDKGGTADQAIEAGRRVLEAGLELCFYVMPGLGGRERSAAHAAGTARVLRAVAAAAPTERPLVVRLRTTAASPGTPLEDHLAHGRWSLPDDLETVREIRDLLVALEDARLELRSDHSLNLFLDLEGSLPLHRPDLLHHLDRFLQLPPEDQAEFALGRRLGLYTTLDDLRPGSHPARDALPHDLPSRPEDLLRFAAQLRARSV